jgi:hypothetical protein
MVERFEPPQNLLRAGFKQCDNLVRAQESVPVNKPNNLAVAFCKLDWGNCGSPVETG